MAERHEFDTGAVRSADVDEERWDLISPIGLQALARTYAEGAKKFGAANWENGMPVTDLLNHGIAHIYKFLAGDRSEDHLAHAAWNILGAIHSLEKWPQLNDGQLRGPNCDCPAAAKTTTAASEKISIAQPTPNDVREQLERISGLRQ
jgi:Domain of unknown function (DUF5664)